MSRSSLAVSTGSRTRWLWRALTTTLAAALLAGAGLAAASPAAAKRISDPFLEASVGCSTGDDGAGVLQLSGLFEGYDFTWAVTGEGYSVGGTFVGTGYDAEIAIEGLAPGVYATSVAIEHFEPVLGEFTVEACAPDPGVAVTPLACSTGDNGEALVTLTGLANGIITWNVRGPNFVVGGSLDEFGETEEIDLVGMPPGNYYAYVEWHPFAGEGPAPVPVYDWVGFAIEPCQPVVEVEATECTTAGGTGALHVSLSTLVDGVEYLVWVTDQGVTDGTPYGEVQTVTGDPTGTAQLDVSSLPGGRAYTVWVDGVWEAIPPWEEPPFLGNGGNFDPLESVVLATSADFSLQPCPAAPVKPASTTTLPATGPDGVGGALLAAVALLGFGVAALLTTRRHKTRARDLT
jgi:hypothetical protein